MSAPASVARDRPRTRTGVVATTAALFGLFYAYAVWNAVDFLVSQASGTLTLNGYGWFVLLLAVVFPLIAFGAAFAIGWRRRWWEFALVLLTGLAVVAVFWLDIVAYSAVAGASMLG
ncbi:bacitracin resistance protein [Microbacterium sp.]|uniref:bacitracin resistance protein n=1 Tax=Microbacterium sp. TaxID=51671 RepID=UPI0039E60F51